MDNKLTIKIDRATIERAKRYAKKHNTSLSRLVENYLGRLTSTEKRSYKNDPLIRSLSGIIQLDKDDHKSEYKDYLEKKYNK